MTKWTTRKEVIKGSLSIRKKRKAMSNYIVNKIRYLMAVMQDQFFDNNEQTVVFKNKFEKFKPRE